MIIVVLGDLICNVRIIYFQCFFYGFLVSNIYKSSLVAHLTSPSYSKTVSSKNNPWPTNPTNQVDTLEELVASDDFSWGIVNYGAADYQLFATSEVKEVIDGFM